MSELAYCPNPDPRTLLCNGCGRPCEPVGDHWRHARARCGATMRYGETCARSEGHTADSHGKGHRTRWAMDNAATSRRTGWTL